MKQRSRIFILSLSLALLSIPAAQANSVSPGNSSTYRINDTTVYAKTQLFQRSDYFTDRFHIDTAGNYRAVLTDFAFPNPLGDAAFNIATASASLGSLYGSGAFEFAATPGDYFVSFFGVATATPRETVRAQRFSRADDRRNGNSVIARRHSIGDDNWSNRYRSAAYRPGARGFELNLGQYGIEISHLPLETVNTAVIPVPAAIWLFASGLAGLAALGAARRPRG